MSATNVIAIRDIEQRKDAGAIVMWRLDGAVDEQVLRAAWDAAGLDAKLLHLSVPPTTALRRAAMELRSAHVLVRPLHGETGWAVVSEEEDEDSHLSYTVGQEITMGPDGMLQFSEACSEEFEERIARAYLEHLTQLSSLDISSWLARLVVSAFKAVALRDGGGVYFIPADFLDGWHKVVKALQSVSTHRLFEIPALHSDDAVEMILASVLEEANKRAEHLEEELASGKLGARALATRAESCSAITAKVAFYEELLGVTAGKMRERLEMLNADIAAASLSSMEEATP